MTNRRGWHEGSILRLPNGDWRVQISIKGKRPSFRAKTRTECVAWVHQINANKGNPEEIPSSSETMKEYLESWMESTRPTLRPRTANQYEQIIRDHILPLLGRVPLADLRPEKVDQFYGQLLKDGLGIRTIRLTHSVLHVAMERAVKYGKTTRNPAHGAQVPKQQMAEMSVLDEEQVSRFLTASQGTRFQAIYHLAVVTGMRQGELFGLKWADVSWTKGILNVRRQVQRVKGKGCVFSETKTRAGRRTIKLGEGTLQSLREHYQKQQFDKAVKGTRWKENDLIFPTTIGTPLAESDFLKEYHVVLTKAGLPKIRFHDLRHTAASLMLNHGVPVLVVSKILGHSKPSVTLDIYGHLYNEMQDDAARIMDDLVTPLRIELPKNQEMVGTLKKRTE